MICAGRRMVNLLGLVERVVSSKRVIILYLHICYVSTTIYYFRFANVVKVDGGSSFGELIGPTKQSSSIFLNSKHCFLASDDKSLTIYRASPTFKFVKSLKDHEGFVQVVKGNKDGKMVATGGGDGKVFIYSTDSYEGKERAGCTIEMRLCTYLHNCALVINEYKAHDSGILALEWCNNDENILTASADKTVKLWSLAGQLLCSSQILSTWTFEKQICGLQVLSSEKKVIVMRLDGEIEIRRLDNLEIDGGSVNIGHSKGIVDIIESSEGDVISLSYDGVIKSWNPKLMLSRKESKFGSPIKKLISSQIGVFEDKFKGLNAVILKTLDANIVGFKGESQVCLSDGRIIDTQGNVIKTISDNSVDITTFSNSNLLAISTGSHLKILSTAAYEPIYSEPLSAKITAMSFNNGGTTLAIADDQRRIRLYTYTSTQTQTDKKITFTKQPTQWCNHSARIDVLYWTRGGLLLSAGVDCSIMAWSLEYSRNGPVSVIRNAHVGPINCITSVPNEDDLFISGASDSCIKVWHIHT